MKSKAFRLLLLLLLFLLAACGTAGSDQVPVAELPDPAIYALTITDLPDVGVLWQQSYNQTSTETGFKWSYMAYQAYQPGSLGGELDVAYAINNDVVLYEANMRRESLPQPPASLGNIQGVTWKAAPQLKQLGDKSSIWKTTLGDLMTPVWWLEFYQGHAYVRISLLGFPDQIASSLIYRMGDIIALRLPKSVDGLRSDAATRVPTQTPLAPVSTPQPTSQLISPTSPPAVAGDSLKPATYSAPPGDTGMVAFTDDTGSQLVDGIVGTDDILADLGLGTAYEWVGWMESTEPVTLTFTFSGQTEISAVQIGVNHRDGLGVFVPARVNINGVNFELAPDAVPNNQRKDLEFTGPFSGSSLQVVLYHRGRGWILVDEVRFIPASE